MTTLKLIAPTRNDDEGCIQYDLYQDNSDPSLLYFLERWQSDALLDKHLETPHLRAFVKAVENLVSEMEVNRLTPIA